MMERETVPSTSEDIHHSIADADDMEAVWDDRIEVVDVIKNLLSHPFQIVHRWNWKLSLIGALLRASFYFTVYKASRESWAVTMTAVLVELGFRFITTGIAGAVVQSFRRATPVWLANVIVSISLPAFSHTVEYITHWAQERYLFDVFAASENHGRQRAFAISVLFSAVSALFNLFAMRRGVLLVGAGEHTLSFGSDLKRIPRLVGVFVCSLPVYICTQLENGRVLYALGAFVTFGLAIGGILGAFRGKWYWAWTSALGAWAILFGFTILIGSIRWILRRKNLSWPKEWN